MAFAGIGLALLIIKGLQTISQIGQFSQFFDTGKFTTVLVLFLILALVITAAGVTIGMNAFTLLRGRRPNLRPSVLAYSTYVAATGLIVFIAILVLDASSSAGNAQTASIIMMLAGGAGIAAGVLWGPDPQKRLASGITGAVGAFLFFIASMIATSGSRSVGAASFAGANLSSSNTPAILTSMALLAVGAAAIVAAIVRGPGRVSYVFVLAGAALLGGISHLLTGLDYLKALDNGTSSDGLVSTGLILIYIAGWICILAFAAFLTAAILAAVGFGSLATQQSQANRPAGWQMPGQPAPPMAFTPAPAAPAAGRRLQCPQCKNVVNVMPGQKPICGYCGFGA